MDAETVDVASSPTDEELVARAGEGDEAALCTLYVRHRRAAERVARRATDSAADAEDATAEGFLRVLIALPRIAQQDIPFRPYLLTCVRNAAIDQHRRRRAAVPAPPERPSAPPEDVVLVEIDRDFAAEALRALPERWQTVLWLTEIEGLGPEELAPVMGITANAVAALGYRARERLRAAWLGAHLVVDGAPACRRTVEGLSLYLRGRLRAQERARIDRHLQRCPGCRRRRDELAEVNALLRAGHHTGPAGHS